MREVNCQAAGVRGHYTAETWFLLPSVLMDCRKRKMRQSQRIAYSTENEDTFNAKTEMKSTTNRITNQKQGRVLGVRPLK
jgi:hypothetical protein